MQFAHGRQQWLAADVAGTVYTISGLPFQPKAFRFYWVGISSTADAQQQADGRRGIGFATGTAARRCVGTFDDDGAASMVCSTAFRDDCVAMTLDGTPAVTGRLDLNSITSDGFTLIVDDAVPANLTVFWEAWGGDDVTVAEVLSIAEPAATGNQDYTVTGFTSDGLNQVVMFAGVQATGASPTVARNDSGLCVGAASGTAAAENILVVGNNDNGSANADTDGYGLDGECLGMIAAGGGNPNARAQLTTWLTDAFRLNWIARGVTNRRYIALAIKGGLWTAGSYTVNTQGPSAGDTATVSGLAFRPIGISAMTRGRAENTAGSSTRQDILALGSGTSPTDRRTLGYWSENGVGTSVVDQIVEYDELLATCDVFGGQGSLTDLTAINDDGFQVTVEKILAAESTVTWQGYLAFGTESVTLNRDFGVPIEFLIALVRLWSAPVEWRQLLDRLITMPVEHLSGLMRLMTAPVEFGMLLSRLVSAPVEWRQQLLRDAGLPVEFSQGLARDLTMPVEVLNVLTRTMDTPVEWTATLARLWDLPVEWQAGVTALDRLFTLPTEILVSLARNLDVPVEALRELSRLMELPIESGVGLTRSVDTPVEFLQALARALDLPVEVVSAGALLRAYDIPVESLGQLARLSDLPVELSQALDRRADLPVEALTSVVRLGTLPVELLGGLARDLGIPVEAIGVLLRTLDIPVELLSALARLADLPVELLHGLARPLTLPVEGTIQVLRDFGLPIDNRGVVTLDRDFDLPIDTRGVNVLVRDFSTPVEALAVGVSVEAWFAGAGAPAWWYPDVYAQQMGHPERVLWQPTADLYPPAPKVPKAKDPRRGGRGVTPSEWVPMPWLKKWQPSREGLGLVLTAWAAQPRPTLVLPAVPIRRSPAATQRVEPSMRSLSSTRLPEAPGSWERRQAEYAAQVRVEVARLREVQRRQREQDVLLLLLLEDD